MSLWMKACPLEDLRRSGAGTFQEGRNLAALFYEDGRVYATAPLCPHMGFPLAQGSVRNGTVTCRWHGWKFEAETGRCLVAGGKPVGCFKTEIREGDVWVLFPEPAAVRIPAGALPR